MGVGHLYGLFACMVTARSWKSITQGVDRKEMTQEEVSTCQRVCVFSVYNSSPNFYTREFTNEIVQFVTRVVCHFRAKKFRSTSLRGFHRSLTYWTGKVLSAHFIASTTTASFQIYELI